MRSQELLQFYRQASQQTLVVVDVETTGSLAWRDRITEISVLQASLADGVIDQQTSLLNPGVAIPPPIIALTGISQAMVNAAPPAAEVLPGFLPMLSQGLLTAHNISFDYPFLQSEYARLEIPFDRPSDERLCTVELSRLLLADLPSRSLPKLVEHFGFDVGRSHRAEADTMACWLLAKHLLTLLQTESDDVLLQKFGQQSIPLKTVAAMLGCSPRVARSQLAAAGIAGRAVGRGRSQTWMYRRAVVEAFVDQHGDRPIP